MSANIFRKAVVRPACLRLIPSRHFRSSSKLEESELQKAPKRDPELYVCDIIILLAVMTGAGAIVGWYFGSNPTSVTSEVPSGHAREMAQESSKKKVQYHPHGDRDYPSPLHTVVVDNVTLPADLHERFNKYDKEEWDF